FPEAASFKNASAVSLLSNALVGGCMTPPLVSEARPSGRATCATSPPLTVGLLTRNYRSRTLDRLTCYFLEQVRREVRDLHPFLLPGIAIAHGNGFVFERLMIDGDAEWRADFILTRVQLSDTARVVVNRAHDWLE